jgi:hypothetical protein
MQLKDREPVIGTMPTIYIGHRFKKDPKTGHLRISPKWHADYNYSGRKFHEPLKTTSKSRAISAAHVIAQRIERGEQRLVQRHIEWQEFRDSYVLFLKAKGRAPKTIEKYDYVLDRLIESARRRNRLRPDAFGLDDVIAKWRQQMEKLPE